MEDPNASVQCRSYTHARRYPWVIGRIGGWQLPTQLTLAELAAMGALFVLLVETRTIWAHLPRMLNLVVLAGIPAAGTWAVRHLRMEGRSPLRGLVGVLNLLATPRRGRVQGRAYREAPARHVVQRVFVTQLAQESRELP